jgi:cytochrome c biogenesis protein CcmG, thiol:disulfide interchange protein DsbE
MAMMASETPQIKQRSPATSAVLIALLAVGVGVGIWQDRETDTAGTGHTGIVAQVLPARADLATLPTAPDAGALAPNFRLPLADGGTIELADLRGTPVFVNFWASWSFFCLTEMPAIQWVSEEYGDEVVMLGVNVSDTPEDIAVYAENNGLHYPFPMDSAGVVRRAYDVRQMPTSVFIDEHGVISSIVYGVIVPDQMREHIKAMLGDDATANSLAAVKPTASELGGQSRNA